MEIYTGLGEVLRNLRSVKEHTVGRPRDDRRIIWINAMGRPGAARDEMLRLKSLKGETL